MEHQSRESSTTNADSPFFALLIGINNYETRKFPSLRSAVPDALAYKKYLTDYLKVPSSQIHTLLDSEASRAAIIAAFLSIADDERIKEGDPIFIFYAGHGSEVDAPPGWEAGGPESKVQVLVPQNYCEKDLLEVPGIYDHTIGALLEIIAEKKGNNITVVLDCCHAASGTRGPSSTSTSQIRSVVLEPSIHTEELDSKIWEWRLEVPDPSPIIRYSGLRSHILIAACRSSERARESFKHGAFSAAFLKLLRTIAPDQLRYSDILTKMDRLSDDQNPQIEGANQHRYLFDAKVHPPPPCRYTLRYDVTLESIVVDAGTTLGITKGTEFAVVKEQDAKVETPLATLRVEKSMPFLSILESQDTASNISPSAYLNSVAIQTKAGERNPLLLYIPSDGNYRNSSQWLQKCRHDFLHIRVIDDSELAHLEFTIEASQAIFRLKDKRSTRHNYHYQFPSIDTDVDKVVAFLKTASHYFWELDWAGDDSDLIKDIQVSFYKLQASGPKFHELARSEMSPVGRDLCEKNVIDFVVEEDCCYGIKLTNNGRRDLYPNLSYFDNMDLSCTTYYKTPSRGPYVLDAPLAKQGGSLTIGYGSTGVAPLRYCLLEGHHLTIGFLKLSVFTRPFSPSPKPHPHVPPLHETWGTILIPMMRRYSRSRTPQDIFVPPFQASATASAGARINSPLHLVAPRRSTSLPTPSRFF